LFPGALNKTLAPDPGTTGSHPVCHHEFTYPLFEWEIEPKVNDAIVYAPGKLVGDICQATASNCPLVLILHADGEDPDHEASAHLKYDALGRHLASRGFVVVSVNRRRDDNSAPLQGSIVGSLYRFINAGGLGIKTITNSTTAIIGHSAGGRGALQVTAVPAMEGWTLKCLCLLSPTTTSDKKTLIGTVSAFASIMISPETDGAANGVLGLPMETGVKAFEDAAVISNNTFAFEKHLIRVETDAGHYYQGQPFALTYIAAFLHRYQREDVAYQQFIKGQKIPFSLKKATPGITVSHLHEDIARKLIVEMDASEPVFSTSDTGVTDVKFGSAPSFDVRSWHTKRVLSFKWNRSAGGPNFIKVNAVGSIDASAWKLLSFNIAQIYFDNRETGPDVDLRVALISMSNGNVGFSTLKVVDFEGLIRYPVKVKDKFQFDATRNMMRAINLPIEKFVSAGNNNFAIGKVTAVEFNFGSNPIGVTQNAVFMINEIKLLK
jgi:hypothetical protein